MVYMTRLVTHTATFAQSKLELAVLLPSLTTNSLPHSPIQVKSLSSLRPVLDSPLLPLVLPPRLYGSWRTTKESPR